jgi:1-acyl-sn-glycerol-3-phosphate acyltransferase
MTPIQIALSSAAAIAVAYFLFWVYQAAQMKKSGYLTPGPYFGARTFMCWMARFMGYLLVGPIKLVGKAKAKRLSGPIIFAPNHTHEMDFVMARRAIGGAFRYMAAANQLFGLRALFGAWTGAFPMNFKEKGGGVKAVHTAVKVLTGWRSTNHLLVFPQGKLVRDNVLRPEDFRGGIVRIARIAYKENGKDVTIVPMGLHYIRDAEKAHWSQRVFGKLRRAFGQQNFGGVVVVGDPIMVSTLPADETEAIAFVRERIADCLKQAAALA